MVRTEIKWLITGGCGFIGTSLIKRLVKSNCNNIRVIDNFATGTREDLSVVCRFKETTTSELIEHGWNSNNKTQLVIGDILDEHLALCVVKDADIIVHLAANTGVGPSVQDPRSDCYANVIGTLNYLEAARFNKVKRFIFASSGAPAGEVEPPIHEELPPHPVSPYGASKLAGEGYCSAYARSFGVETVALRFGNVYGPGSIHKSSVVAKFIQRALEGKSLEIYGDGFQTRDFIYIDDLVEAVVLAATMPGIRGETFQIASSKETTVGEMAEQLVMSLGAQGVQGIRIVNAESRVGDVKRNYSDTTKAKKMLRWQPRTSFEKGIVKTIEYFLNGKK